MLLSRWAAGIFTASPHTSEDEGVAAATFIWEFRKESPKILRLQSGKDPQNIEYQNPQNLERRDESYSED